MRYSVLRNPSLNRPLASAAPMLRPYRYTPSTSTLPSYHAHALMHCPHVAGKFYIILFTHSCIIPQPKPVLLSALSVPYDAAHALLILLNAP